MPIKSIVHRAGEWFLDSGIHEPVGGVARFYRADLEQNRLISTEITGYAVSTLVYLHLLSREERFLKAAVSAASFLRHSAWQPALEAFPCDLAVQGDQPEPYAYFFDSGIIVRGLLALWRVDREPQWLEIAKACGLAMGRDFADGKGDFHPILHLPDKKPLPREDRWSRSPGCYQLKSAMAWQELFEETGDTRFNDWYHAVLAMSLRTHTEFLPGAADENRVMDRLHAYCYFLEGLLPRAFQAECAGALRDGIASTARYLRQIGPRFDRSDVYAQLLRVRLMADVLGVQAVDRVAAQREAEQLAAFASDDMDQRIYGGFYFGRKNCEPIPHVNPVSTGFGLQALHMWSQYCAGSLHMTRQQLI